MGVFIKNALIADAIGSVELKDLPPEIDQLVSLAVDSWDKADEQAVDAYVLMILLMLSLGVAAEQTANRPTPPAPTWPPRDNFPRY